MLLSNQYLLSCCNLIGCETQVQRSTNVVECVPVVRQFDVKSFVVFLTYEAITSRMHSAYSLQEPRNRHRHRLGKKLKIKSQSDLTSAFSNLRKKRSKMWLFFLPFKRGCAIDGVPKISSVCRKRNNNNKKKQAYCPILFNVSLRRGDQDGFLFLACIWPSLTTLHFTHWQQKQTAEKRDSGFVNKSYILMNGDSQKLLCKMFKSLAFC